MKKIVYCFVIFIASILITCSTVLAEDLDLTLMSDEELKQLYEKVRTEMNHRGLPLSKEITLREGKFIVGEDIVSGTYTITCLETTGETLSDMYSSLGNALDSLDEEDSGTGDLMNMLGGIMEEAGRTKVQVLGDYGSVLKSFELKKGESATITLEEHTAIEVSDGVVSLETV